MAFLAVAAPYIAAGAAALSAYGTVAAGNTAKKEADYQAKQLDLQAGQEEAAAQYQAEQERRQGRYLQSRAQAVAAASGAGAADPTVTQLSGTLAADTEYNALSTLWTGRSRSNYLTSEAAGARYSGKAARNQANVNAVAGLASDAATLYTKYGLGYKKKLVGDYKPDAAWYGYK